VPLTGVVTNVRILDYIAEIEIVQRFENIEADPIEAVYADLCNQILITEFIITRSVMNFPCSLTPPSAHSRQRSMTGL
jgi:hypothetical protein